MELLLLAISHKHGGLCVAGIDLSTLEYVRLCHFNPNNNQTNFCDPILVSDLNINGHQCDIMDVIDVTVKKMSNNGCQTENFDLISVNAYLGVYTLQQLNDLYSNLKHNSFIFLNPSYKLSNNQVLGLNYSLELFGVSDLNIYLIENAKGHNVPVADFYYNGTKYYSIRITDSNIYGYPNPYGNNSNAYLGKFNSAYVLVSLPNDQWSLSHDAYFKYIAGVIL